MPERIQRKRTKGWTMPLNTVSVARPSNWGNPFIVGKTQIRTPKINGEAGWELESRMNKSNDEYHDFVHPSMHFTSHFVRLATLDEVLTLYREYVTGIGDRFGYNVTDWTEEIREHLRGINLACWCPLDVPCHGDILLEIANS